MTATIVPLASRRPPEHARPKGDVPLSPATRDRLQQLNLAATTAQTAPERVSRYARQERRRRRLALLLDALNLALAGAAMLLLAAWALGWWLA